MALQQQQQMELQGDRYDDDDDHDVHVYDDDVYDDVDLKLHGSNESNCTL